MLKKILFIVSDFPPPISGGNIRVYKFAKYLLRMGWSVFIIYKGPNKNDKIDNDPLLAKELLGIKMYAVNDITTKINNLFFNKSNYQNIKKTSKPKSRLYSRLFIILKYILSYIILPDIGILLWVPFAFKKAKELILKEKIEFIITSSPPHSTQFIGKRLKKKYKNNIKWIADFRDLWSFSPTYRLGITHNQFTNKCLEKSIINSSDEMIYISHSMHSYVLYKLGYDKYFIQNNGKVITNGYDNEDFLSLKISDQNIDNKKNIYEICYFGTIYGPRLQNKLADGIKLYCKKLVTLNVQFKFIGSFSFEFKNAFKNLQNVQFVQDVSHTKAIEMMQNADVLIMILTNDIEGKIGFTGKFFEYLRAKRPILALVPNGEVSKIIYNNNIGEIALPDSAESIAEAIEKIINRLHNGSLLMPSENNYFMMFDRYLLTVQLVDILTKM